MCHEENPPFWFLKWGLVSRQKSPIWEPGSRVLYRGHVSPIRETPIFQLAFKDQGPSKPPSFGRSVDTPHMHTNRGSNPGCENNHWRTPPLSFPNWVFVSERTEIPDSGTDGQGTLFPKLGNGLFQTGNQPLGTCAFPKPQGWGALLTSPPPTPHTQCWNGSITTSWTSSECPR